MQVAALRLSATRATRCWLKTPYDRAGRLGACVLWSALTTKVPLKFTCVGSYQL